MVKMAAGKGLKIMPKKKDPSVTFLNKFGYNVVKLPRAGIEPLDLIGIDETTQWLGPLSAVWKSAVPVPEPSAPRRAAPVNGQKTDQLDLSFGLKILGHSLAAFGASVPSLDIAYRRARKIQFAYTNVTSTVVAPLEAGNYLTGGTLNSDNPVVKHYFMEPDSQAFVILDVLKSDSITVIATDEHGAEVGVDVPAIQGVVGAGVKVTPSGASSGTITYSGSEPVTFGFIVDEIQFEGGKWSLSGAAPDGALAFAAGSAGQTATASPILLGTGCRVRI
jgi:hypothetical protein